MQLVLLHCTLLSSHFTSGASKTTFSVSSACRRRQRRNNCWKRSTHFASELSVDSAPFGKGATLTISSAFVTPLDMSLARFVVTTAGWDSDSVGDIDFTLYVRVPCCRGLHSYKWMSLPGNLRNGLMPGNLASLVSFASGPDSPAHQGAGYE